MTAISGFLLNRGKRMTFKAVVIKREDADYDTLASFNVETCEIAGGKPAMQYAKEFKSFLSNSGVDCEIIDIANVTDVIEEEYVDSVIKESVAANWNFTLDAQCPACSECVDVTTAQGFWDDKKLNYGEYGSENSTDIDAECPLCSHDFKITCEFS